MTVQSKTATWPELAAILLARLGCLWLLVFVYLLLPAGDAAFHALMAIAFIATIPYSLWLRNRLRSAQFAPLQFLVDLVLVTGLVYFTGGVHSDLALLYPLVILAAGIVGPPKQAARITVLGIACYLLMSTALSRGLLVGFAPAGAALAAHTTLPSLVLRAAIFALFGAASVYVSKRCEYFDAREHDLADASAALLRAIPAPALLLDRGGRILFASEPACEALGTAGEDLRGTAFSDLCDAGQGAIPESYGRTARLGRPGRHPLPITYRTADFQLPAAALPDIAADRNARLDLTLLVFTDLSQALEMERQLGTIERVTAATRIAGELANDIRSPLTALSASVQLLKRYEEKATSADWLPNSPRRRDRGELFAHIEDASRRMDAVVQNFVDFADFSPRDLLSIIKLDSARQKKGYVGHLNTTGRGGRHGQDSDCGRRPDDIEFAQQDPGFQGVRGQAG